MPEELPDIAAILATLLQRVPRQQQPLLIAFAERLAAERYRGWAQQVDEEAVRSRLLTCAEREEEIAGRIEGLYADAATEQRQLLAAHPDLLEINRSLFAPLSLAQQLRLQAQGERLGAATWRAFADHAADARERDVFLGCAPLEERNAEVLEGLNDVATTRTGTAE